MALSMQLFATGPLFDGTGPGRVRSASRDGLERLMLLGEATAKNELYPGHGVSSRTPNPRYHRAGHSAQVVGSHSGGTLRRSITHVMVSDTEGFVGTPLVYAAAINFGWPQGYPGLRGSFAGYHFMEKGRDAVVAKAGVVVGPLLVEALT